MSREQLATAGLGRWRAFLKDGLSAFDRNRKTELGARAFLPLVVRPLGHNPAGELATEILILLGGKKSIAAAAIRGVLSSWKIALDGPGGAILGIELATRLDAPGLGKLCLRLIKENAPMDQAAADALVWFSILAVKARGTVGQLVDLGQCVSHTGLWSPTLAAEYAAALGAFSLVEMPRCLLTAVPALLAEPHTGQYARELAHRLALDFSVADLNATFRVHANDTEALSRFRRTLSSELGFDDDEHAAATVTGTQIAEIVADLVSRTTSESDATRHAALLFRRANCNSGTTIQ